MNAQNKNEYMLLFRGSDWPKNLSPEEMQEVVGQWMAWFKGLMEQGIAVAGSPLEREGKVVSGKNGRTISDGPFAESKEAIGGYFLLQVGSMDEAVAIAQQCPGLAYGSKVEVRPILNRCSLANDDEFKKELIEAHMSHCSSAKEIELKNEPATANA